MSVNVQSVNHIRFNSSEYEKHREEVEQSVKEVLARNAIKFVVGISGGAEEKYFERTEALIDEFVGTLQGGNYAILTGGTEGGVPQIGIEAAKRHHVPSIGVFPKQGLKYALLDDLDLAIETTLPDIGEGVFGTETPTFVNMLDGATVIGGSYGTLIEVSTILKANVKRIEKLKKQTEDAQDPIYLAPILGTGGVADQTHEIAQALGCDVTLSMPERPVVRASSAAQYLRQKLEADE